MKMNNKLFFIGVCLLFAVWQVNGASLLKNADYDPPIWPSQFKISFEESTSLNRSVFTKGFMYINYDKNHFRIQRDLGNYQPLCQSILPDSPYQCTHLMNNGIKYVLFRTQNLCCKCCQIQDKNCGFYPQNWLSNATFTRTRNIGWLVYNQWKLIFNSNTYLYLDSADLYRRPRQLKTADESYVLEFNGIYDPSNIDDAIFDVPDYCKRSCRKSEFCTGDQKYNIFTNI